MVLDEANELLLVGKVGVEVKPNTLRVVVFEAVIEPLVVAEIESLLLQLPLQVPIGLGDEEEMRMFLLDGRDYLAPVLGRRYLSCACRPRSA